MTAQPTFGQVVVLGLAVATFPLAAVAFLAGGPVAAGAVLAFGWLLAVPLVALLASSMGLLRRDDEDGAEMAGGADDELDPLEALKDRYARGELDDEEFERRLDRLVELDGVEVPEELSVDDLAEGSTATDDSGHAGDERDTDHITDGRDLDETTGDREPAFEQ